MRLPVLLAWLAFAGGATAATEDKDLDLIPRGEPPAVPAVPTAPASDRATRRIYVENALSFASRRDSLLVASPPPLPTRWQERLFADARAEWQLGERTLLVYSGRLNLREEENLEGLHRANVTHDLREAYASFEPATRSYVDAGRINLKSGVALGFNPTDFFKARAVVDPLTADPRALREDRLGTLMLRGQRLGENGSVSLAYAPGVAHPAPIAADPERFFNPLFGNTNASDRLLLKAGTKVGESLSPELLLFRDKGRVKIGANVSDAIGQATVVYLEWAGGRRRGIIDEALAFGRRVGAIPAAAPDVIDQGGAERFRNQAAIGAAYTTESKITFNLEYHYNEAGLSRTDWNRWFAAGEGRDASSPTTRELWFVRAYASAMQEPLQRHAVFLRMDWVDFLVPKLELTGFALADARDGSKLLQLAADYASSDFWSFGVLATATTGGRRSNFGSLPQASTVLFKATRYF
jgi:hypothetical protein